MRPSSRGLATTPGARTSSIVITHLEH
jgi:hypothetical protein